MRCPQCGALNAESAEWCTQCYTSLKEPPEAEEPVQDAQDVEPADQPVSTPAAASTADPDAEAEVPGAGFRRVGDDVEWRCSVCEQWNPLEAQVCTVCGVPFQETVAVSEEEEVQLRDVEPSAAVIASAVLPGLGHALLGRVGAGVIRGATFALWLIGGLVLLRGAAGAGQSILPATPLLAGAGALWLLGVNDTAVLSGAASGRELLTPRVFLWLVVGVVGALILAFVPALLRVTGGSGA